MGTTTNNTNKVINNTMVNININNFIVNGHPANTTSPEDCLCLDFIKVFFNNAKLPFTVNMANGTYYIDPDGTIHVTYTIHTDISAMDKGVESRSFFALSIRIPVRYARKFTPISFLKS